MGLSHCFYCGKSRPNRKAVLGRGKMSNTNLTRVRHCFGAEMSNNLVVTHCYLTLIFRFDVRHYVKNHC